MRLSAVERPRRDSQALRGCDTWRVRQGIRSSATSAASCSHRPVKSDPLTPPACPPASPLQDGPRRGVTHTHVEPAGIALRFLTIEGRSK